MSEIENTNPSSTGSLVPQAGEHRPATPNSAEPITTALTTFTERPLLPADHPLATINNLENMHDVVDLLIKRGVASEIREVMQFLCPLDKYYFLEEWSRHFTSWEEIKGVISNELWAAAQQGREDMEKVGISWPKIEEILVDVEDSANKWRQADQRKMNFRKKIYDTWGSEWRTKLSKSDIVRLPDSTQESENYLQEMAGIAGLEEDTKRVAEVLLAEVNTRPNRKNYFKNDITVKAFEVRAVRKTLQERIIREEERTRQRDMPTDDEHVASRESSIPRAAPGEGKRKRNAAKVVMRRVFVPANLVMDEISSIQDPAAREAMKSAWEALGGHAGGEPGDTVPERDPGDIATERMTMLIAARERALAKQNLEQKKAERSARRK
ncbi:hypothetical protein EV426DRAFT_597459 [Tirmania nivea]|nr:hypothetical protein EV426DRAFT_597459 [Tirmania nivea]